MASKFGVKVETKPVTTEEIKAIFAGHGIGVSDSMLQRIEKNATAGMRLAGEDFKTQVRASIRKGGLSSKWANAWRVNVYPENKNTFSLSPAAYGYHKIPYAEIFEQGGTIAAKSGLLWIPLPTVPKIGRTRATAKTLSARGVKLFSINRAGKAPILATKVLGHGPFGGKKALAIGKLKSANAKKNRGKETSTVALFTGHKSVTIKKRFDVYKIATNIAARMSSYYDTASAANKDS